MASLFANGSVIAWILGFVLLEACVLSLLQARTRLRLLDVAAALGAGAGLLLALRAALRQDPWETIAIWLVLALGAHLVDLGRRIFLNRTLQQR